MGEGLWEGLQVWDQGECLPGEWLGLCLLPEWLHLDWVCFLSGVIYL